MIYLKYLPALLIMTSQQLVQASPVIYVECDNLPPMCSAESENPGMVMEIGMEAVRRAGYTPKARILPWKRAMQEVRGRTDAVLVLFSRTPSRAPLFKWIVETNSVGFSFIRRDGASPIADLKTAQAAGRIGIRRGSSVVEWLERNGVAEDELETGTMEDLAAMLKYGRIASVLVLPEIFAPVYASRFGASPVVGKVVYEDSDWIAGGPAMPASTVKAIAEAVAGMKRDGTIEQIIKRYGSTRAVAP